ncbi:MAG: hypothetical protein AAGC46_04880 [Solirubrobacteraceae bacterium]
MILVVASVALLLGFYFAVLSPQKKKETAAKSALASAQQALTTAQQKLTAGRQAQDDFRRDRTTIVKLGRVVPETDDIPTLLTQLSAIADKYHVEFADYSVSTSASSTSTGASTVTPTTPTSTSKGNGSTNATAPLFPPGSVSISGGLGRTPIELELNGTYANLEKYLRAVERFAVIEGKHSSTTGRLMVVDAFGYEFAADKANAKIKNVWEPHPRLKATLDASIYFAPPLDVPSAASASAAVATTPSATASGSSSTGTATIGSLQ